MNFPKTDFVGKILNTSKTAQIILTQTQQMIFKLYIEKIQ